MKVLELTPKSEWTMEVVCTNAGNTGTGGCNSKLEIDEDDVFRTTSYSYDTSEETCYTIECVVCHDWTDLNKAEIPERVKQKAYAKHRKACTQAQRVEEQKAKKPRRAPEPR